MGPFSACLTASLVLSGTGAATPAPARPDAAQTVQAFRDALRGGEGVQALELLTPEVVIFEAGGAEMSRDEYAQAHLPADIEFAGVVRTETVLRQTGGSGDTGWVLTRYRTRGSFHGKPVDSEETETMLLRDTSAGWRIVHIHWSSHRAGSG